MAIKASDTGGGRDFEPIPEGGHVAICDMMVDLGMQEGGKFGPKHKVYIRFQVPEHRVEFERDGEQIEGPGVIGRTFTISLSDKSHLRPFLESWRGKKFTAEELREFDITKVAGAPAYINIIHDERQYEGKLKTFADIASIMPLPKGTPRPQIEGELVIHDDENNSYDSLPKWLKDKIDAQVKDEPEPAPRTQQGRGGSQQRRPQPAVFDDDLDDDVPF